MSWHFSLALEAENFSDGEPSALWKSIPTAQDDSCSDKMKGSFHRSQFGTMFVPLMDDNGKDLLMWFLVDSLAKTSAQQENEPESTELDLDYGKSSSESSERSVRNLYSSKTRHTFELMGLSESSKILPIWGTMEHGVCSVRTPLALHISGNECGFLPTPTAALYGHNRGGAQGRVGKIRPSLETLIRGLLPTPTTIGNENSPSMQKHPGHRRLAEFLKTHKRLPTLTCGEGFEVNGNPAGGARIKRKTLTGVLGSPLIPFREWMMGWPIGWTGYEPLETDKWLQWFRWYGDPCVHQEEVNDET